ncbi:tetratricopeptide repeat protein [Sporosarcina thermotolerans]|uniref:tetratricopeptide repeat protein n=1 Tax=Sporosarcina thermotolerans TaxID=633404 RepID=UPI0024BC9CF8|nr:tetratricopeptide repeat protein [Sporosarcina thermotolerans]WHT48039.1 tetratricopeptide repeat protein [Sporosarcina thermotolerans]
MQFEVFPVGTFLLEKPIFLPISINISQIDLIWFILIMYYDNKERGRHMKIGHLIRAERVRQDMKQIVLAKGICTPSYLSKIERNLIEPSEDIAELLFNRLGIDPAKLQKKDVKTEKEFKELLLSTYKLVITSRSVELTEKKLDYLLQNSPLFENDSLYYTYLLITLRFRIILGKNFEEISREIEALSDSVDGFDTYQKYLFLLNQALFYYNSGIRKKAISYFEEIVEDLDKIPLGDWEKAEFYYVIAILYTSDENTFVAIEYIRKALNYFMETLQMNRVLECYIIIGVTRKLNEQFEESLEAYSKAMQLCEEFHLDDQKGIIYHNIGNLNSIMGNSEQAILYFKKSYDSKVVDNEKLISILCLIMEHSKRAEKALVLKWANIGIDIIQESEVEGRQSYLHHFKFYKSLHSEEGLSEEIALAAIQYFKDIQEFKLTHKYCIALADWYYYNRKYKLSSIYYREANTYGNIYRKIVKWEDL